LPLKADNIFFVYISTRGISISRPFHSQLQELVQQLLQNSWPRWSNYPSPEVTVAAGANQTFTITPLDGYSIKELWVDGVSVGAVPNYTFIKHFFRPYHYCKRLIQLAILVDIIQCT